MDSSGGLYAREVCSQCGECSSGVTAAPLPASNVSGESQYLGCFVDDGARDLNYGPGPNAGTGFTFADCDAACASLGYLFMSLQYGGECFCANAYGSIHGSQYAQVADTECAQIRQPCSDASHLCGGSWRNAIYQVSDLPSTLALAPVIAAPAQTEPSLPNGSMLAQNWHGLRRDKMRDQVWKQRNERDSKVVASEAKVKVSSTKKQKTAEPTAKQKMAAASGEAVMFQAAQTMSRSSNEL